VDPKERAIRELYDARARRDWDAVASLLADPVGWHEPGEEDHSGDFRSGHSCLKASHPSSATLSSSDSRAGEAS
jgi:ketosteroid isomerase-like protein